MTITLFLAIVLIVYLAGRIIIEITWSEEDAKREKESIEDSSTVYPGENEEPNAAGKHV